MLAPCFAVLFSSLLRNQYVAANFDSPARFALALAVFFFVRNRSTNVAAYLQYFVPLSLFATLFQQIFFFQPKLWGEDRMSTYFADPLVFGYTALTLGLMSLMSINLLGRDGKTLFAFKLAAALIGVYLSIKSGSRTGWLAVPVVLVIWLHLQLPSRRRKRQFFGAIPVVSAVLAVLAVYAMSANMHERINLAYNEIAQYSWSGTAPETAVGMRITFLRIAADMLAESPLAGIGDNGYDLTALPTAVYSYASPVAIDMAFHSGFHNEMISNAVRFGVSGLFAAFLLLVFPLSLFTRNMNSVNIVRRGNAKLGLVLTICFLVSSFSTEVFDLKYMASFYATLIALLCGSVSAAPIRDESRNG